MANIRQGWKDFPGTNTPAYNKNSQNSEELYLKHLPLGPAL
jgi:hypothetical protein